MSYQKGPQMIQGHGDDLYLYKDYPIRCNFSSNVHYGIGHERLFHYLNQCWSHCCSYPEPLPFTMEKELAGYLNIQSDETSITNGATEAIYLIAQTFSSRKSGILLPAFSEYADACRLHGHKIIPIYYSGRIPSNVDMVWLCNPNNPTGETRDFSLIQEWIERYPSILFIIDQSYEHFTNQRILSPQKAVTYPNVIQIHSMTKSADLPGLRIGYITANADLIRQINLRRTPWSVNSVALDALHYILCHPEEFKFDPTPLIEERERVTSQLASIPSIEVWPSDTHILLSRLRNGTASALKDYLVKEHGLLIRDAGNFAGLDNHYFRICIQDQEKNDLLIDAIKQWIEL